MTLYQASMLFSIAGPLLVLALAYLHRREIAYMLTGNTACLREDGQKPGAVADERAVKEALGHIETTLAHERRAVQTLKARPHMADLTDRLAAVDVTLNEVRESLAQKTRLKA